MTDTIAAFLIGIAPWALGVGMLYGLLYQVGHWRLEHHMFIIGSAAYMGYLWIAVLMAAMQHYSVPVFSDWLPAWMILSVVMCWALGTLGRLKVAATGIAIQTQESCSHRKKQEPRYLLVVLSAWLVVLTVSVFWEVVLRPAVAWDALSFWSDAGYSFLIGQLANQTLNPMSSSTHPVTIKYVGAWGAFALYERSASGLYLPWVSLYFGTILLCVGLGRLLSGRWWLGLTAALLMVSSPVIQAHSALGGYADLWLGAGLFLCLAWLSAGNREVFQPNEGVVILTGLTIISLAFLKGNGVAYSIILLGAMLLAWVCIKLNWAALLAVIVAIVLVGLRVWDNGVDWSFSGYRLAFLPEEGRLALGQREAALASNSWIQITRNFWNAWGVNNSFYLAAVMGFSACMLTVVSKSLWRNWLILTGLFLVTGLVVLFALGQHISEELLFDASVPSSDINLSRFTQVIHSVTVFFTLTLGAAFVTQSSQYREK